MGLEQPHRLHDQVVEVERVGLAEPALVERVRRRVALVDAVAGIGLDLVGVAQLVLVVADPVQDRAGLVAARVEVEVVADQGDQPLLVLRVVDREVRLQPRVAEVLGLLAQDPHAGGVEGADPHDLGAAAHQVGHPLLHLRGGLVGERDRQDRARVGLALGDQPGDPPGQHPRLAGPRAGHHEQRRPGVLDGLLLRRVEPSSSSSAVGPRRVVRGSSAGVMPSRPGSGYGNSCCRQPTASHPLWGGRDRGWSVSL